MARTTKEPVRYSPELAAEICERIAHGESLRSVCRDEGMPAPSAVIQWVLNDTEGFAEHYERARQMAYKLMAEEIFEISDDGTNDWVERENARTGNTTILCDHDHVSRSKLRVDTRKWFLSKVLPKIYGDRIDIGNADNKPFELATDSDRNERLDKLLTAVAARVGVPGEDLV